MPAKKITLIEVARRALEEEKLPYNLEDIDINNFTVPQGKVVFNFGGNTTNRKDALNGNAKIIQSLISNNNLAKTKIFSFMYKSEPINSYDVLSKEYEREAIILYDKVFRPLLYDKKGNMKEQQGIEAVFNRIVFAAHCGGSNFVNLIVDNFYESLREKYSESTAINLINKIQYFAYAPHQLPNSNFEMKSLIITPFNDPSHSWTKSLSLAEDRQTVDTDYPKGAIKRLLRGKQQNLFEDAMRNEFGEARVLLFKTGNSTYMIPSEMNPRKYIGDHSIECISKPQFLNSGTDYETTAKLCNSLSKLYINEFLDNELVDSKGTFRDAVTRVEAVSPSPEHTIE